MSLQTMASEIRGSMPKMPYPYAVTLINRAFREIRERNLWSFQLAEGQWISPAQISVGTATATQGSTQVLMDPVATAAIQAQGNAPYSLLTQRQFRIGSGGVYNIVGWALSPTIAGSSILTLDRMYGEISTGIGGTTPGTIPPGGTPSGVSYFIYQVYYASPSKHFLRFISVRDMQNFVDLHIAMVREELDQNDPQRTWYYFPTHVIPYKPDLRPGSPTYGYMLHELWGAPQYSLNYQLLYIDKGEELVNPTDVLPMAIGEDVVLAKARVYAYEWAEANKGALERNQGPDYRFLMGAASKEFELLFKNYRRQDRETVDNFFMAGRNSLYGRFWGQYNSISGTANPGGF